MATQGTHREGAFGSDPVQSTEISSVDHNRDPSNKLRKRGHDFIVETDGDRLNSPEEEREPSQNDAPTQSVDNKTTFQTAPEEEKQD